MFTSTIGISKITLENNQIKMQKNKPFLRCQFSVIDLELVKDKDETCEMSKKFKTSKMHQN